MPLDRTYPVEIIRHFPTGELQVPSAVELDRGEEDGLAGNQHYQDMRDIPWEQAAEALAEEAALIARFAQAEDIEAEAEQFEEDRLDSDDPLLGLDIGVAGAVFALSALGAVPVGSCNAGGFGGQHAASFPYVAFYVDRGQAELILTIANEANVGLDIIDGGIARVFGQADRDLHRFAQVAVSRHGSRRESRR